MIRKLVLAAAASLFAPPAIAQAPPPPRLVVLIFVDQLSSDLFDEYRPQFTEGLARIASGTVFRNGSAAPAPALGELAKAHAVRSRNVAVSGEPGSATDALSGRNVDQRWYWTGSKFGTDVAGAHVPQVVPRVNGAVAAALVEARPPLGSTPFCQSKPGTTHLSRTAGDAAALAASPELDGDTLALAAGLVDEMRLGRRADPDVMPIRLSATANVIRDLWGSQPRDMPAADRA